MYRLPNVHISQNCIQLLLAIDKTNSSAIKKTPNHWCPSGLSDSDTIFQVAERHCQETCPFSNRTISLEVLCPFPLGVVALTTSPGRFPAVWDLPCFPYFTVLLPSHGQAFSLVTPQILKLPRTHIIQFVSHSDDWWTSGLLPPPIYYEQCQYAYSFCVIREHCLCYFYYFKYIYLYMI